MLRIATPPATRLAMPPSDGQRGDGHDERVQAALDEQAVDEPDRRSRRRSPATIAHPLRNAVLDQLAGDDAGRARPCRGSTGRGRPRGSRTPPRRRTRALSAAALATSRAFVQVKKYGSAQNANTTTSSSQRMMIPRSRRNSRIRTWAVPAASAGTAAERSRRRGAPRVGARIVHGRQPPIRLIGIVST